MMTETRGKLKVNDNDNFDLEDDVPSDETKPHIPKNFISYTNRHVKHDEAGLIKFGRKLVQALNTRIVWEQAVINNYDTTITQLRTTSNARSTRSKSLAKQMAYKLAETEFLEQFKNTRDNLYRSVDIIFRDKPLRYRKIFTSVFLDGKSAEETARIYAYSKSMVEDMIAQIEDDYFEKDF